MMEVGTLEDNDLVTKEPEGGLEAEMLFLILHVADVEGGLELGSEGIFIFLVVITLTEFIVQFVDSIGHVRPYLESIVVVNVHEFSDIIYCIFHL